MKRPIRTALTLALGTAAFGAMSLPAAAADNMICGKRDKIISQLQGKYGETARVMGFSKGAGVVEVFANERSGSWTILITNPTGMSCLMAAGEAFESVDIPSSDAPA